MGLLGTFLVWADLCWAFSCDCGQSMGWLMDGWSTHAGGWQAVSVGQRGNWTTWISSSSRLDWAYSHSGLRNPSTERKCKSQCSGKCFTSLCLSHSYYRPTGQRSHMTKPRNALPLDVKRIYSEMERIYGHFSSLPYFIFLSLVLFIYILCLVASRCVISGYWVNEWMNRWNQPSDSKTETPRHDMAYPRHPCNLVVAAVLRPHSPDLQPDNFLYVGEEIS